MKKIDELKPERARYILRELLADMIDARDFANRQYFETRTSRKSLKKGSPAMLDAIIDNHGYRTEYLLSCHFIDELKGYVEGEL